MGKVRKPSVCLFSVYVFLISANACTCNGCEDDAEKENIDSGQKERVNRFSDRQLGVEFSLSDKWTPAPAATQPTSTIVDARYGDPIEGPFVRPRILVSKQTVMEGSNTELGELLEANIDATKKSLASTHVRIRRISTKSWRIDGVDVASFELGYTVKSPSNERETAITQKSLFAYRENQSRVKFVLEMNATYIENSNSNLATEIDYIFRSLKFNEATTNDDP